VPALYASGGLVGVFVDARGGAGLFVTVRKVSNGSVIVHRSRGQLGASSLFPWRVYKGIYRCPRGAL
jgi:hypothetical protein